MVHFKNYILILSLILLFSCNSDEDNVKSIEANYTIIINGNEAGYCKVSGTTDSLEIDFDYKSNGRGPTIKESIELDKNGFPVKWDISGNSTFGNAIDEHFEFLKIRHRPVFRFI